MNKDEVTMALYQNIDIDALVTAKRNGSLLSYLTGIAERILGPTTQNDYRRREDAGPPTRQPVRVGDSIRVSDL